MFLNFSIPGSYPESGFFPVPDPDPGPRGQKSTGSLIRIRNNADFDFYRSTLVPTVFFVLENTTFIVYKKKRKDEYGSGSTDLIESGSNPDPKRWDSTHPPFSALSDFSPKFSCVQETKVITYKSLTMIKEKDGNHMEEIEEILCKDSRCGTCF
jgi:hypothetical protein